MYSESFKLKCVQYYINNKETLQEVADRFGIGRRSLGRWYNQYKTLDELEDKTPLGHSLKGVSVLLDNDGNVKQQWVKTDRKLESAKEVIASVVEAFMTEIKPVAPKMQVPIVNDDLMACYVLSDFHLGMFADEKESGAEWSTDIAQRKLRAWIDLSVKLAPEAHTGVLLELGDYFHADNFEPLTPASKHALDVDCRYNKVIDIGVDCLRYAIDRMLDKHKEVRVICAEANHDPASQAWLRKVLHAYYADEHRVSIDDNASGYYCFEWGDTSIFAHHGHKRNIDGVPMVFASMFRGVFGRTKHSYGHIGHFHHTQVKESNLMVTQIHPTLAARDAYAAKGGYVAQRRAKTIIYHKKHGEVGTIVVTPDMI